MVRTYKKVEKSIIHIMLILSVRIKNKKSVGNVNN